MNKKQSKNNVVRINEYDFYLYEEAQEMERIADELLYDEYIEMEEAYNDQLYREFVEKHGLEVEIEEPKESISSVEWVEIKSEETNFEDVENDNDAEEETE